MVEYLRTPRVKGEVWYIFTAYFLKTIEYPMEDIRLTKRNWKN